MVPNLTSFERSTQLRDRRLTAPDARLVCAPAGRAGALLAVALACTTISLPVGCSPPTSRPAVAAPALPPPDTSTPEATAKSLLAALKGRVAAAPVRDSAADAAAREQVAQLVATDAIYQRLPAGARRLTTPQAAARSVSDTWPALVAFYVEHLDADHVERLADDAGRAHVRVSTVGGPDAASLKIECVNLGGTWRVARLEFDPPRAASQPTSN